VEGSDDGHWVRATIEVGAGALERSVMSRSSEDLAALMPGPEHRSREPDESGKSRRTDD
jgi:hypothetical protein